jgi:hypothetical protein
VGWDVADTTEGLFLLEANLSCNFFHGTFDQNEYYSFLERQIIFLESRDKV